MTKLEELHCNNNQVANLDFVARMQKLRVLNCNANLIEDLSPLLDLPDLQRISIRGNPLNEQAREDARQLVGNGVQVVGRL